VPKISDAKREARRAEIAGAALRCFARTGYQRTSMADIIAESGLSAGAIYSYFPSKRELITSVAERILDDRRAELEAAGADRPLAPAEIVRMLARGVRANAPVPVLIQVWGEATVDPDLRAIVQVVLTRMRTAVTAGLERWAALHPERVGESPDAWASAVAPILMSLLPGFILQSALIDDFDEEGFLSGLGTLVPDE